MAYKTQYTVKRRLFAIFIVIAFLFLLLFSRLCYVALVDGRELTARALEQWSRDLPITAERGLIKDRNGIVLAGNETSYSVYLRPRLVEDGETVAKELSDLLELDYDGLMYKIEHKNTSEYTLKKQVSKEVADQIIELGFAGVYLSVDNSRVYPYGDLASQVLGYTSVDNSGQAGLEQYYENYLKGINGQLLTQSDLVGFEIDNSSTYYVPAIPGLDLELTIDYYIQRAVENVLKQAYLNHKPNTIRCVVMEPSTGKILAMANYPGYDLNTPPRDDLSALNALSRNSLVVDIYEPGSTFKIFTASANLEEYNRGNTNCYSPDHIFPSTGTRTIDGRTIKCWHNHADGRHDNQNLSKALNNSCNPIFVDLALAMGTDTFYSYLEGFGFSGQTGIDFVGEANPMLINKNYVMTGDLARMGFGQTIAVSPIQLITAACAVINGGYLVQPHLLEQVSSSDGRIVEIIEPSVKRQVISERTSRQISAMLEDVVTNGSGKQAYIEGAKVGGKTGTAQKFENGQIAQGKYVSSFVGFYPSDAPKYAALFIVDEPEGVNYGSTVAAPYVKLIFEQILALNKYHVYADA